MNPRKKSDGWQMGRAVYINPAMINGRRCRIRLKRPNRGLPAGYESDATCFCPPPGVGGWAGWTILVEGREVSVHESDAEEIA